MYSDARKSLTQQEVCIASHCGWSKLRLTDVLTELLSTLQQGISKIKTVTKDAGDPRLRLERYLIRTYEKAANSTAIEELFVSLGKMYPNSATLLLARVEQAMYARFPYTQDIRS